MRSRQGESGGGWVGTVFWLAVVAALGYAGWHVMPTIVGHYALKDAVAELARTPRHNNPDDKIRDMVMKAAAEERLDRYIEKGSIQISTTEVARRIAFSYEAELDVLPGYKRVFHFEIEADQPIPY